MRKFAAHLMKGAPSEGSGALSMELSRRYRDKTHFHQLMVFQDEYEGFHSISAVCRTPVQLFEDYSVKDMTFNPPIAGPPSKKKVFFHQTNNALIFFVVWFSFLNCSLISYCRNISQSVMHF